MWFARLALQVAHVGKGTPSLGPRCVGTKYRVWKNLEKHGSLKLEEEKCRVGKCRVAVSGSICPKLVSLLDLQEPGDAGNYHTTTLLQNKAEFLVMRQLVPCL